MYVCRRTNNYKILEIHCISLCHKDSCPDREDIQDHFAFTTCLFPPIIHGYIILTPRAEGTFCKVMLCEKFNNLVDLSSEKMPGEGLKLSFYELQSAILYVHEHMYACTYI